MMKKELLTVLVCFIFTALKTQLATAQNWVITGNNNTTALSKLGTTNFIPLNLYTNNVERVRIDEIGRVGIGISAPVNVLTVKSTAGNPSGSWLTGLTSPVFVGFADNASSEFVLATASNISPRRSVIQGRRSRGTLAAPAIVANNDYLTSFLASGYDGSAFQNPATIDFFVDGTPSAGNVPARISFVTGSNQINRQERLKVGSTGNFNFNGNQITLEQSTGNVGIGVVSPLGKLEISHNSSVANPHIWLQETQNDFARIIFGNTATTNFFGISGRPAATNEAARLNFYYEGIGNIMTIRGDHRVGIGTINPGYLLDVAGQMRIQGGGQNAGVWLTDTASASNVSFVGLADDNTVGLYGSAGAGWGLGMNLSSGNVGVGTVNPSARFRVAGDPSEATLPIIMANTAFTGNSDIRGILSAAKTNEGWGIGIEATGGYYGGLFWGDGGGSGFDVIGVSGLATGEGGARYGVIGAALDGSFNAAGYFNGDVWAATYNVISDRKFKAAINPVKNALQQIMKLKPSSYVFKKEEWARMGLPAGNQLGLIADELKQVFPELVKEAVRPAEYGNNKTVVISPQVKYESVNYIGLIPVLVASIQEQQQQIELQQIQIRELKEMVYQLSTEKSSKTNINSVNLEQNNPNPLDKFTSIRYSIPPGSKNAQLIIIDVNGKRVKQVQLGAATRGNISFDATGLVSGAYTYSIVVDGKLTQSKKMVVVKSNNY